EVAEIDERVPQPKGVPAPSNGLRGTVEEVSFKEGVDIPLVERRGRPRFEGDPAVPGREVDVLPHPLGGWACIRDEVVAAADRVKVVQPREPDEATEPERGVCPRHQERAGKYPARDELLTLFRSDRHRRRYRGELGHPRRLPLVNVPRLVSRR